METGPRSASDFNGLWDNPAKSLESTWSSLRSVELSCAPLHAGAQHWRNMNWVAVLRVHPLGGEAGLGP